MIPITRLPKKREITRYGEDKTLILRSFRSQGVFQPPPMGGGNLIKVVRAFPYFSGVPITFPKSLLFVPKILSISVVGLLEAQFLILQIIVGTEPMCT